MALSHSPQLLTGGRRVSDYTCLEVDVIENLAHSRMEGVDAQLWDALEFLVRDEALHVQMYMNTIFELVEDNEGCQCMTT